MAVPDGRSSTSLAMMIRAGSHNPALNHAVALSDDGGDTWGTAELLPIIGATCEGSMGRDRSAAPGEVLLAAPSGYNHYRLGRGNMSVFSLNTGARGSAPISRMDVWPQAAGYSDFAQTNNGQVMLLYEAGGGTYDYGIKISPVV